MSLLLKVLTGLVSLAVMGVVSVTDPTGDAVGDGTIVAPTAPRYANSAIFDLQDVSLEVLQVPSGGSIILLPAEPDPAPGAGEGAPVEGGANETVTQEQPAGSSGLIDVRSALKVTLGGIDVSESTALGFGSVVIDVYLDGAPGGREATLDGPGMLLPAGRGWEYAVRLTPDGATGFRYVAPPAETITVEPLAEPVQDADVEGNGVALEPPAAPALDYQRVPIGVALQGSTLTLELPWDFPDQVVVYALSGVHDPFNPTGWRPLATTPSPWAFSGGEQVVPVIDLIAPDQETQDAALKSGILPLPAVAAGDAGLLWLLLMALGLVVAATGLVLRRRVPAPATRQLRTGLPPEPVDEALVPAPKRPQPVQLAAASVASGASSTSAVASESTEPGTEQAPDAVPERELSSLRVVESDRPDGVGAELHGDSEVLVQDTDDAATPAVGQADTVPALSGISAFDSYVLSEVQAEDQEPDEAGFDDLAQNLP